MRSVVVDQGVETRERKVRRPQQQLDDPSSMVCVCACVCACRARPVVRHALQKLHQRRPARASTRASEPVDGSPCGHPVVYGVL